ncbi:hypothetical protein BKG92_01820 [Rodentibacter ratti]|uniref:Adhesin n=1 Tax=Rodentibacter ratti TaxID=1906745 RepID=A0A1V3L224_9PAST|nr:ESPR-type extended signal peptide-containing protein [Rodentibacter ratti]OOF83895.1 hypothetical protein BKG92_01820 [Rodentibacter ratti]
MNKIFKVIWNYATQSWVAVSELQKAKGKTKSLSKAVAISALVSVAAPGYAASVFEGDGATASEQGIALGDNAKATGGESPIAVGVNAEATNKNDIAIGNKAGFGFNDKGSNFNGSGKHSFVGQGTFTTNTAETISTHSNLAIGINAGTNATGIRNIAIGENAATQHFGEESITIGYGANNFSGARKNTDGSALAAGDTYRARRTIAIGKEAMTYGEESIAIGYGANTKQASFNGGANYTNASGAVALGRNATASGDSSFAQGLSANAQGQGDIAIGIAARTLLDPSSLNNARNFRIAIGREAKVGEAALNNALAIGSSAKVLAGNNGVALGAFTQTIGNNLNVALGSSSRTWGDRPNAIGNSNTAGGFDSSAIGAQSHVLMRYGTNDGTSNNGVAVGAGTVSGNSNAVALGNAVAVFGLNSGALSASSKNPIAENSLKLGDTTKLGNADNTASPITIIGGDENFAIGNNNVIGSSSNNMVMGNRIAVGATSATTNGLINIYRLAIKDSATGQVTAQATAYIKEGSNYYAFNQGAAGYKGAQLDLSGKTVADEVQFVHIVPTFNNTKSINRAVAIGQSASVNDNDTIAIGTNATAGDSSKAANTTMNAIAIGNGAQATGNHTIAVGTSHTVSGNYSGALGNATTISGTSSYSVGNNNNIVTSDTFTMGSNITVTADNSVFLGKDAAYTAQGGTTDGLGTVTEPVKVGPLTYEGFAGKTPVGVVSVGDAGKERRIQNVAAGLISADSTDAINGSQLYATNDTLANLANSTKNLLGGDATLAPNGTLNMTNIGGTGKGNIHDAIAASITEVEAGTNIASVVKTEGANGQPVYTVNADGASVSSSSPSYVTVTPGTKDANNVTDYAVDLSQAAKDSLAKADTALQNIVAQVNGAEVKTIDQKDNTINFVNGNATTARKDGTNITFDVETDNDTIKIENGKLTANTSPLSNNATTGLVETPTNPTALVNASTVANAINNAGFTLKTSADGGELTSTTGDELITPSKTVEMIAGKNLAIKQDSDGKITYATKENVTFTEVNATTVNVGDTTINTNGLTIKDGPSITNKGVDAGNKVITNVTAGVADTDAVNVSQLKNETAKARTEVVAGDHVSVTNTTGANGQTIYNVSVVTGNITGAEATGDNAGKVTVADADKGKVATVDNVAEAINSAGWLTNVGKATGENAEFFTTTEGAERKVSAGDKVIFQAGKNMEVKQDGDNVIYTTSENVTFTEVNATTVNVGDTTITTDGLTINNGPSITNKGVDAGNKVITNVKAGVADTDAVNVSQLKNETAKAKTEVEAGDHISVNQTTGANGQTIYNVSVTTGNITKAESTGANAGKVTVSDTDKGKVATVDNVAEAINSAGWLTNVGKAEGENANFFTTKAGEERKVSAGDKVIFQAGKNMEVKQDGVNVIYATSENVTFNTVQVGGENGPKITGEGNNIKIGDKDGNPTKITNVAAGTNATDAVNVSQLEKATAAAKTRVEGNQGVSVTSAPNADGSTTYTVAAKTDGTTIKIDASGNIAANTGNVTIASNVDTTDAAGNVIPAGKVSVAAGEGSKVATVQNVADAINSAGWVVNTGKAADQTAFTTEAGIARKVSAGDKVNFQAGKNMEVKRDGDNIIYATSDNVSFNSVNVGNTNITTNGITINNGPSMTTDGINAGNKVISNVAPGVKDNDAVNVSQLKGAVNNINSQLNKMDKRRKAGHASGLAVAGLMQAYREGQSAVTAGVGQYQNQSAVAVGYSRIADSGKYGVKAAFTANTQGEVGGTLSAGYFW